MTTAIRYLRLFLHVPGRGKLPIGYLSQYGDILRVSFEDSYVSDPKRPTLSLSYRGDSEADTQAILRAVRDARVVRNDGHLPTYFENLLPEGRNRERLASERHCRADDQFELIAAAGHDLMGAIEVEPVAANEGIPDSIRHWHTALGLDVLEPGFVESPVEDAAAIPGVIDKFSAVLEGRRYVVRRHGAAGSYILKLPSTRHPSLVQNEFACYQLCKALNLNAAKAEMIPKKDADIPIQVPFDYVLAVKRFDRGLNGERIHIEEFAQALGYSPNNKYGKGIRQDFGPMLAVLQNLSATPEADLAEFVKRFIAFILMGNTDAHLKNWSLIYSDGITPSLSPLYDPVCITALFQDVSELDYGVNRKIDRDVRAYTWDDLEALLRLARVTRVSHLMKVAKTTVQMAKDVWPSLLKEAPESVSRSIVQRLNGGVEIAEAR
jgi:serine/threonine-protein kinase HipA